MNGVAYTELHICASVFKYFNNLFYLLLGLLGAIDDFYDSFARSLKLHKSRANTDVKRNKKCVVTFRVSCLNWS